MGTPTIITVALASALVFHQPLPTAAATSCSSSSPVTAEFASGNQQGPDDDQPPPKPPQNEDAYFCCDSVDPQGKGSGEGCEQILHTTVAGCSKVLHCTKGYTNDEGKVSCTDG